MLISLSGCTSSGSDSSQEDSSSMMEDLLAATVTVESGGNVNATNTYGANGLFQITADGLGKQQHRQV